MWSRFLNLNMQFRNKMILSFFIVISLTAIIMGYSYYRMMSRELEASTLQGLERMTTQSVDTLDLHFKTVSNIGYSYFSDTSLQKFLDGPPNTDNEQYYRNRIISNKLQNPLVSFISITRLDGQQISSYYYYNRSVKSLLDEEQASLFDKSRQMDGTPFWTVSHTTISTTVTPVKSISYIQLLKRITMNEQHPIGYIKIDIDPGVLDKIFPETQKSDAGKYYIADRSGHIIFARNKEDIGKSIAGSPLFAAYKKAPRSSDYVNFRYENQNKTYIGFYERLDAGDWIVIGNIPLDQVLSKVNSFRHTLIVIAMISFLAAMLIASLIAAGVTRPLKELNKKMKQVEMGDFGATIEVKGKDELSTIQHSFNKMTAEISTLISKVYETELLKKEAEIKALQTQINPHFLYNTLSTIDSISSIDGDERVSFICVALGSMLRYNLNGGSLATVQEEITHLNQYLSIYQIRFANVFAYEIEVEPGIEDLILPKFLIQPLVENAIIHGLEQKVGSKKVRVTLGSVDESFLKIIVEDNGVGMDPAMIELFHRKLSNPNAIVSRQTSSRTMIGLANVFKRIQLYYESDPRVEIYSQPGAGTKIYFELPKRTA
ncbi:cache domain-containing sensor histidine kinase [Paenibacillus sp. JDR-2]|uniref:cache domain-containing sensor histidine kinase n=1 Tax=Paenibacillus sp. (strain JDR-2) TaxID=324057 RepID=UPI000166B0C9|nr:sensor histidine kinase [Paenibacillus sp. JDR-2]ACS99456.1 putative sensor with HAMP domain [Paenibacillus sp. JDR-2]